MIRQMMRDLSLARGLMDNSLVLKKVVKRSPPHRFVAQVGGLAREGGEAVAEEVQWSRGKMGHEDMGGGGLPGGRGRGVAQRVQGGRGGGSEDRAGQQAGHFISGSGGKERPAFNTGNDVRRGGSRGGRRG